MNTLERAIAIAAKAHEGQTDKGGAPYILHPLRVMMQMRTENEKIVAVLHDVLEDTNATPDDLRAEGFSEPILMALDSVTRRDGEPYEAFIQRAKDNPIGRAVKIADLIDNSDLSRMPIVGQRDRDRVAKYALAIAELTN
jgi:(p)ppGpp synthase/HD superfamily hydrolase